jgi:chorismate mutase/prephenate dehydratase
VTGLANEPVVAELRDEIAILDRRLIAILNDRIRVADQIFRHKLEHGIPLFDRERESQMLEDLNEINSGPLSKGGLQRFYDYVLGLTKMELAGLTRLELADE